MRSEPKLIQRVFFDLPDFGHFLSSRVGENRPQGIQADQYPAHGNGGIKIKKRNL
jgi:hypothetical protein